MAEAIRLKGEEGKVIAVIGDGSMTAGLAFEGLNQTGHIDQDVIVILNDNEMSISRMWELSPPTSPVDDR